MVNELPGVANMAVPSKLTSYFDAARPVLAATEMGGITASEIEQARAGVVVQAGISESPTSCRSSDHARAEQAGVYGAAAQHFCRQHLTADAAIGAFERLVQEVAGVRTEVLPRARAIAG